MNRSAAFFPPVLVVSCLLVLASCDDEFDSNGDGQISLSELRAAMKKLMGEQLNHREMDEVLRDVVLNGDGQVDFEEFVRMMSR